MKYESSLLNFLTCNRIVNSDTSRQAELFIWKLEDSSPSLFNLSIYKTRAFLDLATQRLLHKEFVTNALQSIFYGHSIFCGWSNAFHLGLCYATHREAPCGSRLPPCIVCSGIGNCSNAFPDVVHWEGKYKMGLHLAWFESRILREKCIIVTASIDETIYPFKNSGFFWEL